MTPFPSCRFQPLDGSHPFRSSLPGYLHIGGARTALFPGPMPARRRPSSSCGSKTPTSRDQPQSPRRPFWMRWFGSAWITDEGRSIRCSGWNAIASARKLLDSGNGLSLLRRQRGTRRDARRKQRAKGLKRATTVAGARKALRQDASGGVKP